MIYATRILFIITCSIHLISQTLPPLKMRNDIILHRIHLLGEIVDPGERGWVNVSVQP